MVRGEGCYLYDEKGVQYLDTRNNVCHVGHAHPNVAAAVSSQVSVLNTNSRYLHQNVAELSQRLLATFPPELSVVFFVNSGSEANDLALRLARCHTGNRDVVVVDDAYHGHTASVIDISPYKYLHKGGNGKPDWVHQVTCPNVYRGPHRGPHAGPKYAEEVKKATQQAQNGKVAAFFVESGMSVAGVILPPEGYLSSSYAHVRAAGGVCVADEVQVGFGRLGEHFWGFQHQGVVPDIVTMGKPFGNGMPLAAVVTTKAVSDSFNNGLEYFNTFGGNPVCAAAGLAVMKTLQDEGLQERAASTGRYLRDALWALARKHSLVGDIRGQGLFVGVEFVRNRTTLEPATQETGIICSRLKDEYKILTSIDGPSDSVMVFKPPMVFGPAEVDKTIAAMDTVLSTLGVVDKNAERTPT